MRTFKQFLFFGLFVFVVGCQDNSISDQQLDDQILIDETSSIASLIEDGELDNYISGLENGQSTLESSSTVVTRSPLTVFYDQAEFLATCSDLVFEDFNEAPILFYDCYSPTAYPLDETSDDAVFSPGDIAPGISFEVVENVTNGDQNRLSVITDSPCFQELPSENMLLVNYIIDEMVINLDPGVTSFGADFYQFYREQQVDYYGASGLLGSIVHDHVYNESVYVGVISEEPITQIIIADTWTYGQSEGIDNISFGNCSLDADGDGCTDDTDPHPNSNVDPTLVIDGCDTGVANVYADDCSTMSDLVGDILASDLNDGQKKKAIKELAKAWVAAGLISNQDKAAILACN